MKRNLRVFLFVFFALLCPRVYAESLRVGYFVTSPHVIVEEEQKRLTGSSVEFFEKLIAPEMGVTVIWEKSASSIPRQLEQLEKNLIDAGLVFAKNEERAKLLNYPENPFFVSKPTLAFLKDHPIQTINKAEDLSRLLIGYGTKAYLSPFMRDQRITFDMITTPNWMDLNWRKLLAGRNDAIYQPERSSLLYYIRKHHLEGRIKLISLPEHTALYSVFSKKADPSLAERYDRAFEKIKGSSSYIRLLSNYLDVNEL